MAEVAKLRKTGRLARWGYAAVLFLALAAVIVSAAQSYRTIDHELTELALSRRASVSYLAATVLSEKFDRLSDIGIALATRVRFRELVEAGNWAEAGKILRSVPDDFPSIERTTLHDRQGTMMADVPEASGIRGQNFSHRDWYQGAMRTGGPYISQVFKRLAPPQINVFVAAIPIKNAKGEVLGILVLQVRADRFFDWVKNIEAGPGGAVYVIDRQGQLAAHPQFTAQGNLIDYSGVSAVRRVLAGERGIDIVANPAGSEKRVVAFEPTARHGWGVVLEQPAASVFATRDDQLGRLLSTYGFVSLCVICVVYLVSRIFVQRGLVEEGRRAQVALERAVAERTAQLETAKNEIEDLYNGAPCCYHSLDSNGVFVRINDTGLQWLGYTRDEVIGKMRKTDILTPESAQAFGRNFQALKEHGEIYDVEYELVRKDGSIMPVSLSATAVRDSAGKYLMSRSTMFDITQRRKAERELSDANRFLDSVIENIPNMIFVKDAADLRFMRFNRAGEQLLGYLKGDLLGRSDYDFFPKEEADFFTHKDREVLDQGKLLDIPEEPVRTRSGEERILHTKKIPVVDEQGNARYLLGISEDITERRRAEWRMAAQHAVTRVLAESNTLDEAAPGLLRAICESMHWEIGTFWRVDLSAGVLRCVEMWHMPSFGADEFRAFTAGITFAPGQGMPGRAWQSGKPFWVSNLVPDPAFPRGMIGIRHGLKAAFGFPIRLRDEVLGVIDFFGSEMPPLDDELSQMFSAIGSQVGQFIERKRAEEEIRTLNTRLQGHASQLEAANKELESFAYSVSHDLRSPLRAIDGFSRILEEDYLENLDGEGRRLLTVIRVNSQKMGQLIDDLLAFSRLGRKPLVTAAVDMQALVHEVLRETRAVPDSVVPECTVHPLPPALGDRVLLHQVWVNLLANAIKFTRTRQNPAIEVSGHSDGNETVYRIRDNGVGFDMQYYDKLFGVFQRLHSEEEFPGTGVGLAIVQRVVSRHGGRVWAEGAVDCGATFYFSLPGEA
jgi:PAS domain S-box-containing protein